jgi:hypothetical protein
MAEVSCRSWVDGAQTLIASTSVSGAGLLKPWRNGGGGAHLTCQPRTLVTAVGLWPLAELPH